MDQIDAFSRSVVRWLILICLLAAGVMWVLPSTSTMHIKSFVFGSVLSWALFMVRVRRAKRLATGTQKAAGKKAGLGAMAAMGAMALFIWLAWMNPGMDALCAALGLAGGNVAVIAAGLFPALVRSIVGRK